MKKNIKIAIIGSFYWKKIVTKLEKDCIKELIEKGTPEKNINTFSVPGSLEIPLLAKKLAKKKTYDAIIALGVIHKGKTYHFEMIANECIKGCMNVSLEFEIPVIFEVLAVYDIEDAKERAKNNEINRGVEAANAALKMIEQLSKL